ncbi:MAG: DegT/DnrJ/EryC1/StrS family aminotransferase [Flavobacteriales bacterium]|nr:DegT/DnrJ/EryC1/StrS family aminotransferase [Flavobacteriales bacterium]
MNFIPIIRPDINDDDIKQVTDVLKSGNLVHGVKCLQLEADIANLVGVDHCSAVANGTASLILALRVLGVGIGDEVIVPALSFVATANAVEVVGATPIFVDIDLDTFNINVDKIEEKITPNTKAIMPVHEFGLACEIERIVEIGLKHGIPVVEDAACALGASYNDKMVGSFGALASFSLHPRKAITSGEGGLVVTNNAAYNKHVNQFRNHGIEVENGAINFVEAGYNFRLTDFQAALVVSQLSRFKRHIEVKREIAQKYMDGIKSNLITLPSDTRKAKHTWQTYHLLLNDEVNRDEIVLKLKERNIGSGLGAQCIPEMLYYKKKYKNDSIKLYPNALKAFNQGLAIPMYGGLNESEIQYIIDNLNNI